MRILHVFRRISGQLVNSSKSSIYFSLHFPLACKEEVLGLMGFLEGAWPCIYRGVPLHVGRVMLRMFDPLLAEV